MFPHPPGSSGSSSGGGAPPHLQDDRAPPVLDPAAVNAILTLVNSHLDENRHFNNPTLLDEIQNLMRNSDPADDIVDKVEKLFSEAQTETETERPTTMPGSLLDHAPSDPYPAILDEIRRLNPGVLDEIPAEEAVGEVRKLGLKAGDDGGGESEAEGGEVRKVEFEAADGGGGEREVEVEKRSDDLGESWKGYENESDIWGQYAQSGGGGGENESDDDGGDVAAESWSWTYQYYPVRPEAEDCAFYLKTGTCKFGSNCKFNHPVKRKSNQEREESAESLGQTECKYHLRPGGCKYGNACRYIHSSENPIVAPVMDTNFAGLPIRPGEKDCAYYMRHGECKYASNCRFNHPDPMAEGGSDPSSALQGASEATWSAPRSLNETPPYVPMMIPPSPGVLSQATEWNGYQSPARSMPAGPPYVMNNSMIEINIYKQYPYLNQVEEFPERPGEPVCSYFLRTGDCKFKSSCKYHHPKI